MPQPGNKAAGQRRDLTMAGEEFVELFHSFMVEEKIFAVIIEEAPSVMVSDVVIDERPGHRSDDGDEQHEKRVHFALMHEVACRNHGELSRNRHERAFQEGHNEDTDIAKPMDKIYQPFCY